MDRGLTSRRPVSDAQLDLLARRLTRAGVGRRDFLGVTATLAALGVAGGASTAAEGAARPAPGETLAAEQVLRLGGWYERDPHSHDYNKDLYCGGVRSLFAGLMKFDSELRLVPSVATDAIASRDGSVWTFPLRPDARWSDGSRCTAHDFVYSLTRQLAPATNAPQAAALYDIKNAEAFHTGRSKRRDDVGVRALDDRTLEISLEGPRAYFGVLMGTPAFLPAHRPSVEKYGDRWTEADNIVCNGPFQLDVWQHGTVMVLRRNPHFFGAADVLLDRVVIRIMAPRSATELYLRDALDVLRLQGASVRRFEMSPELAPEAFPFFAPGTWYLIPQVTKPPFDNLNVRRAVSHAIDRAAVAAAGWGFAVPAHSMVRPGLPGARDDATVRRLQRFDPDLAMSLLRGTPYEGGRKWPRVTMTMREESFGAASLAQAVQGELFEHLNLRTELRVMDPRKFRERLWLHEFQLVWIRFFVDYPDPQNLYGDAFYSRRTTGARQAWRSDTFDAAIEAGRQTLDPVARLAHYARAEDVLQTEVGYIPVAWIVGRGAAKPWVRGFQTNRAGERLLDGDLYADMLSRLYVVRV